MISRRTAIFAAIFVPVLVVCAGPLQQQHRLNMARRSLRTHQDDRALGWLEAARAHNAEDADVQFLTARAYRRLGALDLFQKHLARARQLGFPGQRLEREQWLALAQSAQLDEAEPHLEKLLADPQGDGQEICEAYVRGYLRAYRLQPALSLIDAWQADFPDDPQPRFWRGRISESMLNDRDAVVFYREAVELAPDRSDLRLELAKLLAKGRGFQEAEEHFRRCAEDQPENPDILAGWADCLLDQGQFDRPRDLFRQALERNPHHFGALYGLGRLELRAHNKREAVKWLQLARQQDEKHAQMRFALATALQGIGQTTAAKEHFQFFTDAKAALAEIDELIDQVLKEPTLVEPRYQIGIKMRQYVSSAQGAIWLHSVLQLDPSHAPTHKALAAYYAEQGRPDLAERHRHLAAAVRDGQGEEQR